MLLCIVTVNQTYTCDLPLTNCLASIESVQRRLFGNSCVEYLILLSAVNKRIVKIEICLLLTVLINLHLLLTVVCPELTWKTFSVDCGVCRPNMEDFFCDLKSVGPELTLCV